MITIDEINCKNPVIIVIPNVFSFVLSGFGIEKHKDKIALTHVPKPKMYVDCKNFVKSNTHYI